MLARWFNDAFTKIFLKNGKQVATTGLKIMPSVTLKNVHVLILKKLDDDNGTRQSIFLMTYLQTLTKYLHLLQYSSFVSTTLRVIWYLFTSGTEENSLFKCSSFRILYKRRWRVPNETNCEQKYRNRNTIDSSFS